MASTRQIALIALALVDVHGQVTNIAIGTSVIQPSTKRFGINLGNADYYASGQLMKNLISRNPGFEGEIYQSIIRCASGTATTCVDESKSAWTDGFWKGANFQIFAGSAKGRTGTVSGFAPASGQNAGGTNGGTFTFASSGVAPAAGDYMIVRMTVPGNAMAGWWPLNTGSGTITTNLTDLPPGTTGHQTAQANAPTPKDSATIRAFFDNHSGRSFVLLNGTYQLSFKAKGVDGSKAIAVNVQRLGLATYLNTTVNLTDTWKTYTLVLTAAESGSTLNSVGVSFGTVGQDSFLLDDVSLTQTNSDAANTTAFRDPVVSTLQTFAPGSVRYWGGQLGETLDNLITDPFGRQRSGYSAWYVQQEDISYGLHEFLQLCELLGAEPWFVVPSTFSTSDASNLIEYLAGSNATPYGSKRALRGHPNPWTASFSKIHLEFGNEAWNSVFKGGSIEYPAPYGKQAQSIFAAMRSNPAYGAPSFDLVLGGQAVSAGRNQEIQNNCNNNDSFAVAPYMMNKVDAYATNEELFGPTFAEPEALVSPTGVVDGVSGGMMLQNQQAIQSSTHPVPLALYEMNLSTLEGSITQPALNSYAPSLGAGLGVADAMLQQLRHGVITQNLWSLTQYDFARPDGKMVALWGAVVDMGVTNLRRPQFLALELANEAVGKTTSMIQTVHSGVDPMWNQPLINGVQMPGAHYLQSYAFSDGSRTSVIVFNLNRSEKLPVTFTGNNSPTGKVQVRQLTSDHITDTNETSQTVGVRSRTVESFDAAGTMWLPPYSMTVLSWNASLARRMPHLRTEADNSVGTGGTRAGLQ